MEHTRALFNILRGSREVLGQFLEVMGWFLRYLARFLVSWIHVGGFLIYNVWKDRTVVVGVVVIVVVLYVVLLTLLSSFSLRCIQDAIVINMV